MSATKKPSTKATKLPAPATKEIKPPAKTATAVKKPAPKPATVTARPQPAAAAIVAAVARVAGQVIVEKPATVAVKEAAKAAVTTISARIDIGFGNQLYLRGEGPGLSWDKGVPMTNLGSELWQVQLGEWSRPFVFKFLVNDVNWSTGRDFALASGASETFTPEF